MASTPNSATDNANWSPCPLCGQPLLIDSVHGGFEPCASCRSRQSVGAKVARVLVLAIGATAFVTLLLFCLRLLYRLMWAL